MADPERLERELELLRYRLDVIEARLNEFLKNKIYWTLGVIPDEEACKALGISQSTLIQWAARGHFAFYRPSPKKGYVDLHGLRRFIEKHKCG